MAVVSVPRFPGSRPHLTGKKTTPAFGRKKLGHLPKHDLPQRKHRFLYLTLLLSALLIVLASTFLRPRMAAELAEVLPVSWLKTAAEQVQNNLDKTQLSPSQAPRERIEALATRFASLAAPANKASPYRLEFRHGGSNGALTYALPDGSIIVTDELLAQLPDDAQVLALLCHELGHLHYRHLLRATIENEIFVLGTMTLLGLEDQAVPRLAQSFMNTEMATRDHYEADRFAQTMLEENGIPRQSLNAALNNLSRHALTNPTQALLLRPSSVEQYQSRLQTLSSTAR